MEETFAVILVNNRYELFEVLRSNNFISIYLDLIIFSK